MRYHKTTQAVLKRAIRQTYFVSHLFLRKLGKVVVPMSTSTFWPLRLCRGCYGSSEAPGGLNILLEVPHKSIFSFGDKILTNSDEWLFFGLYRSSEAPGGLKLFLKIPHKFNFSSGDKISDNYDGWNC